MTTKAIALMTAATIAFAGLSLAPKAEAQQVIKIDGSSTVFPITEAVAEEFQNAKRGKIRVTVGISGTGGGFKKFCRGETDISDASRPILDGRDGSLPRRPASSTSSCRSPSTR